MVIKLYTLKRGVKCWGALVETMENEQEQTNMNALPSHPEDAAESALVHVLTSPWSDSTIGYRVGGFNPGPNVLVECHDPDASLVYERLLRLPTLAWMRGTLSLVFREVIEREGLEECVAELIGSKPDELVSLPRDLDGKHHTETAIEGYWTVLRACKALGMIEGRGVQRPAVEIEKS
jgi:hypothetical protein